MNNYTKALLTKNKKALQFLHAAHGFDFEAEHIVKAIDGRFTYNSVIKEIEKEISGEYTAAVIVDPVSSYRWENLHHAAIKRGKFHPLRVQGLPYWNYNIDYFFSIGDFEDVRKNKTSRVYIIAQKSELLKPRAVNGGVDLSQRFRYMPSMHEMCGDGRGNRYVNRINLMKLDGSAEVFEYHPNDSHCYGDTKPETVEEVIDKSGYLVINRRRELRAAARRLKAERERAAALAADFSEEIKQASDGVAAVKKYITDAIEAATSWETAQKAVNAARQLQYLLSDLERLEKRTFPNIEAKRSHFENMIYRIQLTLNGGKEA